MKTLKGAIPIMYIPSSAARSRFFNNQTKGTIPNYAHLETRRKAEDPFSLVKLLD
jgi:hypothetical protein